MLTHYRRREVRNSIYRYRKIHIDYRSKFSYRFISSISIIYGNTNARPITGQVIVVTCPVIGRAQPELTMSKRQKTGPGYTRSQGIISNGIDY